MLAAVALQQNLFRSAAADVPEGDMNACHLSYLDNALGRLIQKDM